MVIRRLSGCRLLIFHDRKCQTFLLLQFKLFIIGFRLKTQFLLSLQYIFLVYMSLYPLHELLDPSVDRDGVDAPAPPSPAAASAGQTQEYVLALVLLACTAHAEVDIDINDKF